MEHVVALPDCDLKSAIVQNIFIHMDLYDILTWCNESRFWRGECALHFRKSTLYQDSSLSFVSSDAFPLVDAVKRVNIKYLNVSPYYFFFLKYFKPEALAIRTVSENISTNWTEISSEYNDIVIMDGAESLLNENFLAQIRSPKITYLLSSFAKVDWNIVVNLAKEWRSNKRKIEQICFACEKESPDYMANYDSELQRNVLRELIPHTRRLRCREHNPPSVIEYGLSMQNNDETKKLCIRLTKEAEYMCVMLYTT